MSKLTVKSPATRRLRGFLRILTFGVIVLVGVGARVSATTGGAIDQSSPRPTAEDLKQKLARKVRFAPKAESPLEQLIEVAKAFHLPMGIEWRDPQTCRNLSSAADGERTINEILRTVLAACPSQRLIVGKDLVHVYPVGGGAAPNILDLRLRRFQVKNENLFIAEYLLRRAISAKLHPEKFSGGYNGGTGFTPDHVFAVENINFVGENIRVKHVLNAIVRANGNALWLARTTPNPSRTLAEIYNDRRALVMAWRFIPLEGD